MRHVLAAALLGLIACCGIGADGPASAGDSTEIQDLVFLSDSRPVLIRLRIRIDGKPFRAAWDDSVAFLFLTLDTNKDGTLDKDEVEKMLPPQVMLNANFFNNVNPVTLAAMDTNRDGRISRDELAGYYRSNGGQPFQLQTTQPAAASAQARALFLDARMTLPDSNALNERLIVLLDTNHDGKLSSTELAAAPALLAKLDEDDDELISVTELLPAVTPNAQREAVAPRATARGAQAATAAIVPIVPGEGGTALARQLQQRYAPKNGPQAGKKLTQQDIGLEKAAFERLDVDGDGELDSEELARFASRAADVEVITRLGQKDAKEAAVELALPGGKPVPLAANVRLTKDGSLVLDLGVTRLELRGTAGAIPTAQGLREQYLAQFKAADQDANGYLETKEITNNPNGRLFQNLFKLADKDNDGKLFEKEVVAFIDSVQALQTRALASIASLTVTDQGHGLYDLIDVNRDQYLGLRELRQMARLVEAIDRDGDGQIEKKEVPLSYQGIVRQGPAGGANVAPPPSAVAYGGRVSQPRGATTGPTWFRKMDRNGDGDVSRREFLGSAADFPRIDTDGDGLISSDEAERADAAYRNGKAPAPQ